MQPQPLKQTVIAGVAVAAALLGAQSWNSKDYTQWTSEEINTVLTDSPWAKQMNVNVPLSNDDRGARGGNNGGGSPNGGGYSGGGVGSPGGGGYPGGRGGIGLPGGIGFPGGGMGGGGGRRGRNRGPNDGPRGGVITYGVTLRWESALPIQQALLRQQGPSSEQEEKQDSKPAAAAQKFYIVSVLGLDIAGSRSNSEDYEIDGQDKENKKSSDDALRSRLIGAAQLFPKGQSAIAPEDVQLDGHNGSRAIRFLFPKTFPLSASEKEVKFHFETRGVKFEHTFKLNDMVYQGKLAL